MNPGANLIIIRDGQTLKTVPLEGEALLGRAKDCAIRLDDRAVSRQHAAFRASGDHYQVEKKSEFSPLIVNGVECTSAVLKEGDQIAIGPYLIRFALASPAVTVASEKPKSPEPSPAVVAAAADQVQSPLSEVASPTEEKALNLESPSGDSFESSPPENPQVDELNPEIENNVVGFEAPPESQNGESPVDFQAIQMEGQPSESVAESAEAFDESAKTKIISTSKVNVKLVFQPDTANCLEYQVTQAETIIGRGKSCDIVLKDKKASRKNALIQRVGMNFVIKDLDSANGTYVNGAKITEQDLAGNDIIRIGNTEFQFQALNTEYATHEKDFLVPVDEGNALDGGGAGGQDFAASPLAASGAPPMDFGMAGVDPNQPNASQSVNHPMNGVSPGIPGMTGIAGTESKKTLLEKFKALPKRTQMIGVVAAILLISWLMEEEELTPSKKNPKVNPSPSPTASVQRGPANFESLTPEQKQFVEAQHTLAFDYYKNHEYDKAIFEIEKIFSIVPDYKDAKEIQRYAKEGKRKLEAIEEERRKKEDDAKLKAKIAQMVLEAESIMKKKDYPHAKELFSEILAIDPDNASVSGWTKEIEDYEEQQKLKEREREVQAEINQRAWDLYKEGVAIKRTGKFYTAIDTFQKAIDVGASDPKLKSFSLKMIAACKGAIRSAREPILNQAKQLETSGELSKAFELYRKATRIDSHHPAGYAGMNRIRGVLHERAKVIYTEAILAESYSDFSGAKKLFQDCLNVAPVDDIYHERAERKLARYFKKSEAEGAP